MYDSEQQPWSNNPNTPKIPYYIYNYEKTYLAGILIGAILYGIVIVLFFRCMAALLDPVHRRGERIKWGLVSYTVVTFSFATVLTAMDLHIESISYIDNREFPGIKDVLPPGPVGYQWLISPKAVNVVPNFMFNLSNWLTDALLIHRCYVIYSMNLWVIAFPCLMYLGSLAMGIVLIRQNTEVTGSMWSAVPYLSISLSLDTLLTLLIVTRLIVYTKNIRTTTGGTGIGGLCKAIITMLIESCALYAVSSLLVIGPWGAGSNAANIFFFVLTQTQVIAPLLIIQRVANRSALTSDSVTSGGISTFKAETRGELTSDSDPPGGDPISSVDEDGTNSGEVGVESLITIESQDKS